MLIFNKFLSPRKMYEPCGMFTSGHIGLLILCIGILISLLFISRKIKKDKIRNITKIMAVIITTLEIGKIAFNFYWGYTWVNAWFPLSFCALFIYALWLSGYGKGNLKEKGDIFIAGVTIVAGISFLLVPSTALTMYPATHYLSIYSMIYHTMMVYMGVLYLWKSDIKLDRNNFEKYIKFYAFFAIIAIGLNINTGSNLMFLREPSTIPIRLLHNIYDGAPIIYTGIVFLGYLIGPYYTTAYLYKVIMKRNSLEKVQVSLEEAIIID